MSIKKCKHKNIILTEKKKFYFKNGIKNTDKGELTDVNEELVFCEDCGEYLD